MNKYQKYADAIRKGEKIAPVFLQHRFYQFGDDKAACTMTRLFLGMGWIDDPSKGTGGQSLLSQIQRTNPEFKAFEDQFKAQYGKTICDANNEVGASSEQIAVMIENLKVPLEIEAL